MSLPNVLASLTRGLVAILIFSFPVCAFAGGDVPNGRYDERMNSPSDKWQVSVAPYIWFVSMKGDITVKGNTAPVDVDIFDIFGDLNFAGEVHAEIWKGNWGFIIDPTYIDLIIEEAVAGGSVTVDMQYFLMDFAALYRFPRKELANGKTIGLEALVGGRVTYLNSNYRIFLTSVMDS